MSGMKSLGNSGIGAYSRLAQVAKCSGNCPRDALNRTPGFPIHTPQVWNRGTNAAVMVRSTGAGMVTAPSTRAPEVQAGEAVVWRRDFEERFSVGELIGEGQQGSVHDVVSLDTGAVHAVKVLRREPATGALSRPDETKMRSEARFHQRLQGYPAVARMFGAYEDNDHLYIVMERFDAGSMADALEEVGRFSEAESAQLMWGVLRFLSHSHELGICYGDVKPANLMLSTPCKNFPSPCSFGRLRGLSVRAIDFGCCQQMVPGVHLRKQVGSPLYMAPEIFLGCYGVEVDLWSAGVTMFQLLSGRLPFATYDDDGEITEMGMRLGYSFECKLWDYVSDEAKDLISKLLVRAPMKRITAKKALSHPWFTKARMLLDDVNFEQESSSIVAAPEKVSAAQSVIGAL